MKCELSPSPTESQARGTAPSGLGGGVLDPRNVGSSSVVHKLEGSVRGDATSPLAGGPKARRSWVRLGCLAAGIVAGLTVTGCAARLVQDGVIGREAVGVAAADAAVAPVCRPIRRSVVTLGRGGEVRREVNEIPTGEC